MNIAIQNHSLGRIPVYMMMTQRDTGDLSLVVLVGSLADHLEQRNRYDRSRRYWFNRLHRKVMEMEPGYKGTLRPDLVDKIDRFTGLLRSDINEFLRLGKGTLRPGDMSPSDVSDIAVMAAQEAFLTCLIKRASGARLERFCELKAMLQSIGDNCYQGNLPDEMINKSSWLDRMMSADLRALMGMIEAK